MGIINCMKHIMMSFIFVYICRVFMGRSIDIAEAMSVPGVVTFVSAKDIPGSNKTGPVVYDETVMADEKVITWHAARVKP